MVKMTERSVVRLLAAESQYFALLLVQAKLEGSFLYGTYDNLSVTYDKFSVFCEQIYMAYDRFRMTKYRQVRTNQNARIYLKTTFAK